MTRDKWNKENKNKKHTIKPPRKQDKRQVKKA